MASAAIAGTLTGCVGCMLDIESISKRSPGCMNLMTCATFVWISLIGFITQSNFLTRIPPNKIPITRGYLPIVVLFFLVSVSNNLALNFDISIPLFIIFRSGTLLANLFLSRLLLGRIYSWRKIFAVVLVTVGVILFTMASSQEAPTWNSAANRPLWISALPIPPFAVGIGLLTGALLTSAYLGIRQEYLYSTYGKYPKEAMFFIHALSLPGFLLLFSDIWQTCMRFNESPPLDVLDLGIPIPSLWAQLISICLLQWICITNVYKLTSLTSSLNVTMVITLRKFLSLALSIYVFENPFKWMHATGTTLVLVGTLLFTDINYDTSSLWRRLSHRASAEKCD